MDRDDVVGAKAAAQYFIELYPYVYATGDLDEWRAMSHPECIFCESVREDAAAVHAEGGYVVGAAITTEDAWGSEPLDGNPYHAVELRVRQEASSEFSSTGEEVSSDTGGTRQLHFAMELVGGDWSVREVQVEEPTDAGR